MSTADEWRRSQAVIARPNMAKPGNDVLVAVASPPRGEGNADGRRGGLPLEASTRPPAPAAKPQSLMSKMIFGTHQTAYWTPQPELCEYGLLETIHRRTAENTNYVLVASRPVDELQRNFTWPNNVYVDLNEDCFKLSKVAQTMRNIDNFIDDGSSGRDIKRGVRDHLPEVYKNSYFLVKYRDYSPFAIKSYWTSTGKKKDSLFGRAYVERYFAVRIGGSAGCFVPLSEAQCLFGWEKLLEAYLETGGTNTTTTDRQGNKVTIPPRLALTPSEFDSMMALSGPTFYGDDDVRRQQRGVPESENGRAGAASDCPSPWDWTPSAIQKRWHKFLDDQYRKLGRAALKLIILVGSIAFVMYCLKRGGITLFSGSSKPLPPPPQQVDPRLSSRRTGWAGSRRSANQPQAGAYIDDDVPASMFQALMSMDPKVVMDYALAPRR